MQKPLELSWVLAVFYTTALQLTANYGHLKESYSD